MKNSPKRLITNLKDFSRLTKSGSQEEKSETPTRSSTDFEEDDDDDDEDSVNGAIKKVPT